MLSPPWEIFPLSPRGRERRKKIGIKSRMSFCNFNDVVFEILIVIMMILR